MHDSILCGNKSKSGTVDSPFGWLDEKMRDVSRSETLTCSPADASSEPVSMETTDCGVVRRMLCSPVSDLRKAGDSADGASENYMST